MDLCTPRTRQMAAPANNVMARKAMEWAKGCTMFSDLRRNDVELSGEKEGAQRLTPSLLQRGVRREATELRDTPAE